MPENKPINRYYLASTGEIAKKDFSVFVGKGGDTYTGVTTNDNNVMPVFVTRSEYDNTVAAFNALPDKHKTTFKKEMAYYKNSLKFETKLVSPRASLSENTRKGYSQALRTVGLGRENDKGLCAPTEKSFRIIEDYLTKGQPGYNMQFYDVGGQRVADSNMNAGTISYLMGGNLYKITRTLDALEKGKPDEIRRALQGEFNMDAEKAEQIAKSDAVDKLREQEGWKKAEDSNLIANKAYYQRQGMHSNSMGLNANLTLSPPA